MAIPSYFSLFKSDFCNNKKLYILNSLCNHYTMHIKSKQVSEEYINSLRNSSILLLFYYIASIYINANSHCLGSAKASPPSYSPFAISSWFFKKENKFLINLTTITYQVKFNYSSWTSNNTYWNIKGVSSYSDAGMS